MDADFSEPNGDIPGMLDDLRSLIEQWTNNVPDGQLSSAYVFRHIMYLQLLHIVLSDK